MHQIKNLGNPFIIIIPSTSPPPPSFPSPQMHSLPRFLPLYFATAIFTALAYLILRILFRCLRHLLPRRSAAAAASAAPASGTILVDDPAARDQLKAHAVHICTSSEANETCAVCLADYVAGDEVRVLASCGHKFHMDCVDRWLVTRSSFCPICRERAIVRPEEPCVCGLVGHGGGGERSFEELEYGRRLMQVRLEINAAPQPLMSVNGLGM